MRVNKVINILAETFKLKDMEINNEIYEALLLAEKVLGACDGYCDEIIKRNCEEESGSVRAYLNIVNVIKKIDRNEIESN